MKIKHILYTTLSLMVCALLITLNGVASDAATTINADKVKDLREDKSIPLKTWLASPPAENPRTYVYDSDNNIVAVDAVSDIRDYNDNPIAQAWNYYFSTVKLGFPTINGKRLDYTDIIDQRSDKSVDYAKFIYSDAPRTFTVDIENQKITAVTDFTTEDNKNTRITATTNCTDSRVQACLLTQDGNWGFWDNGEIAGNWANAVGFRVYADIWAQVEVRDDNGNPYILGGFTAGEGVNFTPRTAIAVDIY